MQTVYSMTEAKREFEALAERACRGETFIITRYGKPFVKLTPPTFTSIHGDSNEAYKTENNSA
jgi:antitoxin (DNA-binding transcriptional repressor) of toxin-antitoxin stability system